MYNYEAFHQVTPLFCNSVYYLSDKFTNSTFLNMYLFILGELKINKILISTQMA